MVILEECSNPKERLKKQTQLMNQEASLNTTTNAQTVLERPNDWPELDFEMSPGSPTLLLQNIEKQVFMGVEYQMEMENMVQN